MVTREGFTSFRSSFVTLTKCARRYLRAWILTFESRSDASFNRQSLLAQRNPLPLHAPPSNNSNPASSKVPYPSSERLCAKSDRTGKCITTQQSSAIMHGCHEIPERTARLPFPGVDKTICIMHPRHRKFLQPSSLRLLFSG